MDVDLNIWMHLPRQTKIRVRACKCTHLSCLGKQERARHLLVVSRAAAEACRVGVCVRLWNNVCDQRYQGLMERCWLWHSIRFRLIVSHDRHARKIYQMSERMRVCVSGCAVRACRSSSMPRWDATGWSMSDPGANVFIQSGEHGSILDSLTLWVNQC